MLTTLDTTTLEVGASSQANDGPRLSYRTVAARMSIPALRDLIISKREAISSLKSQQLFGAGGSAPIYVREIWPQPVYNLWRKALVAVKRLNYHRAYVYQKNVFVLETRKSKPRMIRDGTELAQLLPLAQASSQSAARRSGNSGSHA